MAPRQWEETRDAQTDEPDAAPEGLGPSGPRSALPELMRKALAMGLSGFFLTEEAVRRALGDTLPKDWIDFAVDQSERTRAEFLERLSYEIGRSLESADLAAALAALLEGRTVEVEAKIRLAPRAEPGARSVRISSRGDADKS